MNLGHDIAQALPAMQAQAVSRMTETVTVGIYRDSTDPVTGDPTRELVQARYEGVGRVRWGSRGVVAANAPAMPVSVQEPYLSVPVGSPRLHVGDEVHVTASSDELLVGRRMRITAAPIAGQVTAHRYVIEEVS